MRLPPSGPTRRDVSSAQNVAVAIVVRLGPLLQRRTGRLLELERIIGEPVELIEVTSVEGLGRVLTETEVLAVVLDAGSGRPHRGPSRRPARVPSCVRCGGACESRGDTDGVFDGYGRLTSEGAVERLADRALWSP